MFIANEFLDAFPVVQFQYTKYGWRENFITHDNEVNEFGFVLSPKPTLASVSLIRNPNPNPNPSGGTGYSDNNNNNIEKLTFSKTENKNLDGKKIQEPKLLIKKPLHTTATTTTTTTTTTTDLDKDLDYYHYKVGDILEISPAALSVVQKIATNVNDEKYPGAALFFDYGEIKHEKQGKLTLRAFQNDNEVSIFHDMGNSDLTADVNFRYIMDNTMHLASIYGPVTQRYFLHHMGLDQRLEILHKNLDKEKFQSIYDGCSMLMSTTAPANPNANDTSETINVKKIGMGVRFKAFAMTSNTSNVPYPFPRV